MCSSIPVCFPHQRTCTHPPGCTRRYSTKYNLVQNYYVSSRLILLLPDTLEVTLPFPLAIDSSVLEPLDIRFWITSWSGSSHYVSRREYVTTCIALRNLRPFMHSRPLRLQIMKSLKRIRNEIVLLISCCHNTTLPQVLILSVSPFTSE